MDAPPPVITTPRLILRPWRVDDADDVFVYARDPRFRRFLPIPDPYLPEHALAFVAARISREPTKPTFAVEQGGRVIGEVNLRVEPADRKAEVGYSIAPDRWGEGLCTQAARVAIDWAFAAFDLRAVVAWAALENAASWRVMEKLGMHRDGCVRRHRMIAGVAHDFVVCTVLREEWDAAP